MPVDIQIDGLEQLQRNLADLPGRIDEAAAGALEVLGQGLVGDAKRLAPRNLGALAGSIIYQRRAKADAYASGVVGSSLSYAAAMEGGRKAGERMPPIDTIAQWIVQKSRGSKGIFQFDDGDELTRIAWGVARNIQKFGIPAHNYLKGALGKHAPTLAARFAALMRKRLAETMTSVP